MVEPRRAYIAFGARVRDAPHMRCSVSALLAVYGTHAPRESTLASWLWREVRPVGGGYD